MVPSGDDIYLDHIAHFVADAETASAALTRAGFAPSPVSYQRNDAPNGSSRPAGTANVTAMLRAGYIEVLFKTEDTPLARELDAAIGRYAGVHLIAFATADAHGAGGRLANAGFRMRPVVALRRPVGTEHGMAEAAFTVARVEAGEMPEGRIQFLTHHTPDLVWQPRWLDQPNGARELLDIVIAVADVEEAAFRFSRFLGRDTAATPLGRAIMLERGSVHLVDPAVVGSFVADPPAPPFIALYSIRVESLLRAHAWCEGLPARLEGDMLVVPFPEALGRGAWIFVEDGRALPWRAGS
jgi:hypothetical protein